MAKRDPGRTVSIHGDKYTYDPDKKAWMSGKKQATPATAAMLDMILDQLNPQDDQEVESFVGTANIIPEGQEQEETQESIQAKEDAHERREDAQDAIEFSPPAAENEKEVAESVKPEPITERELAPPPTAEKEAVELPKPEMAPDEITVKQTAVSDLPETKSQKVKREFDTNFRKAMAADQPYMRVMTDTLDPGAKPTRGPLSDVGANIKEMLSDFKNWFKTRETIQQRESLEKLTDLTPEEITRLEERGIAPASETDFSYRKDGQPLSKEQILAELNIDAEERNAAPEPFYKKRAKQLGSEFKENFRKNLAEEHPWLRLFTDKLDAPRAPARPGEAAIPMSTGGSTFGSDPKVLESLQSMDSGIQQILGILKESDKQNLQEVEATKAIKEAAEVTTQETKATDRQNLQEVEAVKETAESPQMEVADQNNGGVAQEMVAEAGEELLEKYGSKALRKLKTFGRGVKQSFGRGGSKLRGMFGAGSEVVEKVAEAPAVNKLVAKETAEVATKEAAEQVGKKAVGKSLLKKIPGISILAGLAFGAGRLLKGDLTGAAGEVASGVVGTVPGVGTAASVGIDTALAARDISNDAEKVTASAKGNVFPLTAFADGGIVDSPTMFKHSDGAGIMGEAGPEAVMPLERGGDGKLGVKVSDIEKPLLSDQTKLLEQGEAEIQRRANLPQQQPAAAGVTVINNNAGGGQTPSQGGAIIPTAGARNSLDLNYYAQ